MYNKNILITSAGQRVSLVKAFKKELAAQFQDAKVYTVDLNPILAPACHVSDGYKSISRVTDETYIDELLSICDEWSIGLIIPTIDTELLVLAKNKDRFLAKNIVPIVSSLDFVEKCRDKRLINEFFLKYEIEIPKNVDKKNPKFPLFIKPYDGSLSKDTFLLHHATELTDYHLTNPKLMFMEYIHPNDYDEFTVDCYYNSNSQLICTVPRKRIFVRAGEINKGVTSKNTLVNVIKDKLSYIEGAIGCLTMQFFLHKENQRVVAIEINPRFGGGYPLSYLAGANYPKFLIQEYLQQIKLNDFINDWKDQLLMLRYDAEILVEHYEN